MLTSPTAVILVKILFNSNILSVQCATQPNILFILADDLGYNDVGYRGNNQVKTPNIDALAYNGAVLEKFYSLPMCTPTRAAILTGNYPIRTGLQGLPMDTGKDHHLPPDMTTLPEHLKKLGYKTHLVGKWHLGYAKRSVTPIGRGFDSHYGYYNGMIGYFDHKVGKPGMTGLDFRENFTVDKNDSDIYATDLFTNRTVKIIKEHNYNQPLFVMLSHLAAHTGKTVSELKALVEERDTKSMNKNFGYIKDVNRRRYVDVVKSLDDSVGAVIKILAEKNVLDNTIILFLSDNGAPTYGKMYSNFGSNWPLRGIKMGHYEGAIRGTGVFYSKNMTYKGKVNSNLMHITDLLPTFYAAGGGNARHLGKLDGISQYESLMKNEKTKRKELLVNIEEVAGSSAIITNNGRYKFIDGIQYNSTYDHNSGVSGRLPEDGAYDINGVLNSDVNKVLGYGLTAKDVVNLRKKFTTKDCRKPNNPEHFCEVCLYNLEDDPCETTNIASSHPGIVNDIQSRLQYFHSVLVPQQNKPADPKSNPKYFGGVWTYWLDARPSK